MFARPCQDGGMHMQEHPDSNGISIACTGHNLDECCLNITQSPVNGQLTYDNCMPMVGRINGARLLI